MPTLNHASGIASYDSARWTGGAPRLDRVRRAFGISTLLQCGGSGGGETMEADMPASDHSVALFRIQTPGIVDRRITGTPVRAAYRPGEGCLLAPGTDSWWTTEDSNNAGWFHVHFGAELVCKTEAAHNLRLETVLVVADRQIFCLRMSTRMVRRLRSYRSSREFPWWASRMTSRPLPARRRPCDGRSG